MQAFTLPALFGTFASGNARICKRLSPNRIRVRCAAAMSASAVSAVPGVKTIEDQAVKSPIDGSSIVFIVGASRGIGLEFVRQCVAKNARVYATYRSTLPTGLVALKDQYAGKVIPISMDVTDTTSIQSALAAIGADVARITHVVHNAGVGIRTSLETATAEAMLDCFKVNAMGVVLVAQAFAPHFTSNPVYGVLSSKVGSVDDNGSGSGYAYRASKSACNNIAKSLSIDLAGSVSVVLLHPGYVRTDMTGGRGLIDVDESVAGMLRAIEATDNSVGFRFVDYKAELIPW